MRKQYLYKLGKTSKRVASVLSAIALGFGNQLFLPQVGLTQTAGVGIGIPSFINNDDGCTTGGNPDSGDTVTITTNLRNNTGKADAFRVVFRVRSSRGGPNANLPIDLLYGGPTHMNQTAVGAAWDDSYGQVTNTPIIASGGSYDVKANFGLLPQQLSNAANLTSGTPADLQVVAEVFSSDYSVYYGSQPATLNITFRARNDCPSGSITSSAPFLLTASKPVYATGDQITIEQSTIGANDSTIKLPSWGDGTSDIVDIIQLDVPPTGNPEKDYSNNLTRVVKTFSSWAAFNTAATGSKTDEDLNASFNYSDLVGSIPAFTNYTSFAANTLTPNKYYLMRVRPRISSVGGTNSAAGTSSHPLQRSQWTYFAVGAPAPVGASIPDLTITKTHTGNFNPGGTGTYTITATNSGTANTSGTVTVTDTLPTGLTPTTATGTGWNCTISGQTVTCTRSDTLAAGASYSPISLNVNVAANAPSSVTNTATVAGGGETDTANNSASDPTTISPPSDLTIAKTHTGNFSQGGTGTYTITATNSGNGGTSGTVTVTDTLPTGLTPTAANGTGWNCTISEQTVTCTRSDVLAAGASYPAITLTVSVRNNAPSSVTNTATVSGGGEINTANNSSSDLHYQSA